MTDSTSLSSDEKLTSEQLEALLLGDFRVFLAYLWHKLLKVEPSAVQLDMCDYLQHGPRRRMVKGFRGVGKSWITSAYALWRLLNNRDERILVLSGSSTKAREFTLFTRRLIEEIDILQCLKPTEGTRDSVESFDVAGSVAHQQPSVKSLGITSQLQGNRATVIIPDDVETLRNSITVTLRERLSEAVKEFDAIIVGDGDIVYLGTDQNQQSLYQQLPARGYDVRVWPARVPAADKVAAYGSTLAPIIQEMIKTQPAGSPTDPLRFNDKDLMEREASFGRSGFAMQFMLDPALGDTLRYPLRCYDMTVLAVEHNLVPTEVVWGSDPKLQAIKDLECMGLVGDRFHRPMHVGESWTKPTKRVMFVDPSGRGTDETCVAVAAGWGPFVFLLYVGGSQSGFDESTLKWIAETAKQYEVNLITVEPNYGGGMFNNLLLPALQQVGYPVLIEDAPWARVQKEMRIADTLEPVLNTHKLIVHPNVIINDLQAVNQKAKLFGPELGVQYSLVHQLTRLSRDRGCLMHDDRVDAVAGVVAHFSDALKETNNAAASRYHDELLQAEIDKFLQEVESPLHGGLRFPSSKPRAARRDNVRLQEYKR